MQKDLTPLEMNQCYDRINNHGIVGLENLTHLHCEQMIEFINKSQRDLLKWFAELVKDTPESFYPEEYRGKRRLQYWCNNNSQYLVQKKVLETINEYIRVELIKPKKDEVIKPENEATIENDLTFSTIEDWLFSFKEEKIISDTNYNVLVSSLKQYFEVGTFPIIEKKIIVGRVNKKRFGWALNSIYRALKHDSLSIEYLKFAKQHISIFEDVAFDEVKYISSNLYKYFTNKTK